LPWFYINSVFPVIITFHCNSDRRSRTQESELAGRSALSLNWVPEVRIGPSQRRGWCFGSTCRCTWCCTYVVPTEALSQTPFRFASLLSRLQSTTLLFPTAVPHHHPRQQRFFKSSLQIKSFFNLYTQISNKLPKASNSNPLASRELCLQTHQPSNP
jgi:hypothetical protein